MNNNLTIQAVFLMNQQGGSSFAFMLDKGDKEQIWIAIYFIFYKFEPTPECYYLVENQRVKNGTFSLLSKARFDKLSELVVFF